MDAAVDFCFDYASPWSFLADALLEARLPGVQIRHQPVYLRGFPSFSQGMPYGGDKLAYLVTDFARCAAYEEVPVVMPTSFPVNGIHLLRGALVAQDLGVFPAFHRAAFRATWQEGRDVSDKAVAQEVARAVSPEIVERMEDPAIKDRLKGATAAAIGRGAFGVPSFFVGDELFWGHDRLPYVARALGLTPSR